MRRYCFDRGNNNNNMAEECADHTRNQSISSKGFTKKMGSKFRLASSPDNILQVNVMVMTQMK